MSERDAMLSGGLGIMQIRKQIEIGSLTTLDIVLELKLLSKDVTLDFNKFSGRFGNVRLFMSGYANHAGHLTPKTYREKQYARPVDFSTVNYGWEMEVTFVKVYSYDRLATPYKPEPVRVNPVIETSSQAGTGITLAAIQDCFEQALEDLEEGRTRDGRKATLIAKALRNAAQLFKVRGNVIWFVTSKMMKEKFEKPQPKAIIDDIFTRLLGQPVNIRFLTEEDQGIDPDAQVLIDIATQELGGRIVEE